MWIDVDHLEALKLLVLSAHRGEENLENLVNRDQSSLESCLGLMRMHFGLFLRLESTGVSLRLVCHHLYIDPNRGCHCSGREIVLVENDETRPRHMWSFWTTWIGEVSIRRRQTRWATCIHDCGQRPLCLMRT